MSGQSIAVPAPRGFPLPGSRHIAFMLTVASLIAVLVAGWLWSQAPDYRVLYGNLSDRDGGTVIAALQQMNVPYKFADGGALMIPAGQVHEMRLRLAAQGLPKGGLVGFELMESQKFGVSQFAEQINYQRALEGELARSIQSLSAVQNARVHLALSKPSAFLREQPKPSASVLLNLYPGRTLDGTQVSAVVHLVTNSVPDLQGRNVSVVDQNGNLLSTDPAVGARGAADPNQLKYRQEIERSFNSRIEAILTPLTGPNNVRAQVTADLDFSEMEHAEEIYKPNQTAESAVIRSQQTSEALTANGTGAAGGVPGALSNQPPATPTAPIAAPAAGIAAAAPANTRKDATINYEVDKTIRHTRQEIGRIKRIAVAVVVNYRRQVNKEGKATSTPLKEEELAKITSLVKEVMGYNKERGDTVSVMNSAFNVSEPEKIPEVPLWKQPDTIELAKMTGKNLLIAAVLLFVVLRVLRPLLKTLATPPAAPALTHDPHAQGTQQPQFGSYEQSVDHAKQIARGDPRIVANVVKDWVSGNGR
ncbi:MAG: flagellar M-ring protein FliF [Betaproteobacteria bacterium]|nr:flagellar M-ring protein FliF [Betaproteobacteria bacterium]